MFPHFHSVSPFAAQRLAELERLGPLVRFVVPGLLLARARGRESFVHALLDQAERRPRAPAILTDRGRTDFATLAARVERVAGLLAANGVTESDVIALSAKNSLDHVCALLGAARLGASVALVSPEFSSWQLATALSRLTPVLGVTDPELRAELSSSTSIPWLAHGSSEWERALDAAPSAPRLPPLGGDVDFAFVFTSGTTGPSKAARVSHRRAFLGATLFGRLVHGIGPRDVLYCPLPLHHSSALLLGLGACLVTGAALALRDRFSAREFLDDVRRYDATLFLYIGELGRALVAQPPSGREHEHRLRLAVGNGLGADVWPRLQERLGLCTVREFYAGTEFPGAIVNLTGAVGSVGHVPFERLRGYRLVRVDAASGELVRDARGRAVACGPDEPGELVLRLAANARRPYGDYEGYVAEPASNARIARDLFREGDVYCRSGDLLRRDRAGHYYFVDRMGDTFRFKGENVATREVEAALRGLPGVRDLAVVGVRVPGIDGQPGLVALVCDGELSRAALWDKVRALPAAAQPRFARVVPALAATHTFKVKKRELTDAGVDPSRVPGPLYYRSGSGYDVLDEDTFRRIVSGEIRI